MSRFYATFTRQTSYGPLKGSCFSYLFSSFQPQVFLDTEHGWSCLEGQLEEANRHTTQEVCEVLSRHPRHPPLLPGSSRPLPPSPQLRRLVSSSTFSSIFSKRAWWSARPSELLPLVRIGGTNPPKQGHGSSGLARSSPHKGSCVFWVTENMAATPPHPQSQPPSPPPHPPLWSTRRRSRWLRKRADFCDMAETKASTRSAHLKGRRVLARESAKARRAKESGTICTTVCFHSSATVRQGLGRTKGESWFQLESRPRIPRPRTWHLQVFLNFTWQRCWRCRRWN